MKIVAISDVHNNIAKLSLSPADVLVIAGDLTQHGKLVEFAKFNADLEAIKPLYKHIVCIAGNHDWLAERQPDLARSILTNVSHYLYNEATVIDGVSFYGSPITPRFFNWAFGADRGEEIRRHWDLIPNNVDVLITHGPPHNILDAVNVFNFDPAGCKDLLDAVLRIKPKLHIFGHIHYSYGTKVFNDTTFVNAAMTGFMGAMNKPIIIELKDKEVVVV